MIKSINKKTALFELHVKNKRNFNKHIQIDKKCDDTISYLSIVLSENEIEFLFVSCMKKIYNFKLIFEM